MNPSLIRRKTINFEGRKKRPKQRSIAFGRRAEAKAACHCRKGKKMSLAQDPALIQSGDLLLLGKGRIAKQQQHTHKNKNQETKPPKNPLLKSKSTRLRLDERTKKSLLEAHRVTSNSSSPLGEVKKHRSHSFCGIGMKDLLKCEHAGKN